MQKNIIPGMIVTKHAQAYKRTTVVIPFTLRTTLITGIKKIPLLK